MNKKLKTVHTDLNILDSLINKTVTGMLNNSKVTQRTKISLGKDYIQKYFDTLRNEIISEINIEETDLNKNKYISLIDIFSKNEIETKRINNLKVLIHKQMGSNKLYNKYKIYLVFPSRNSSKTINNSIELLVSEIRKSHYIDFDIIFQVNNTSDDTIKHIINITKTYMKILDNVNYYILETDPKFQFSLPGSLNLGYKFIKELDKEDNKKYEERFFSFWDDELLNLIPTSDSLFNSNLNELISLKTNMAISGYMIDNRINVSRWHEICKGFSSDLRFVHSKPYLHGGSGTVMRLKDYPEKGIKLGGIADTDLSEYLLSKFKYNSLNKINYKKWPVRSNPYAPVFHPIEENILKWTTKYLMYQISWENTYKSLDKGIYKKGKLWKKRIDENREDFHSKINKYLVNLSIEKVLDREFMHYYYMTITNIKNKKQLYDQLKKYRSRSLEIR